MTTWLKDQTRELLFWFDSCDPDERNTEELALRVTCFNEHGWNGFHVPLATAAEFRRFIAAWAANDHNGDWPDAVITEGDGALIINWAGYLNTEKDVFTVAGMSGGVPMYAIDGFTWGEPIVLSKNGHRLKERVS